MSVNDAVIAHRMCSGLIRREVVAPSPVPMDDRERIARETIGFMLFDIIPTSGPAARLSEIPDEARRRLGRRSSAGESFFAAVFKGIFHALLDEADMTSAVRVLEDRLEIQSDVMDLLESLYPMDDFNECSGSVHGDLFFNTVRSEAIVKKIEILRWMAEIIRRGESELTSDTSSNDAMNRRPVKILIDSSKTMFGEPEVIAKAVALSVIRRMLSEDRDVHVMFRSDHITSIRFSRRGNIGSTFIDLLLYEFGKGTGFGSMVEHALKSMKKGKWNDADVIMISKGHGVMNGMTLAREWETYKGLNNIRTFSVAPAAKDVRGLTELSDSVYVMDDDSIMNMKGEHSRLICDIG